MHAPDILIDGLSFEQAFDGIIAGFFDKLYSPEKADLMRRAYAASALSILSVRAPFGQHSLVNFPPFSFGQPFKIAENSTRGRAMALYIDVDPAATFIFSSGPGPAGGGSDFTGDGVGEDVVIGAGIGARRFVLLPSEELWATQVGGPIGPMGLFTETY